MSIDKKTLPKHRLTRMDPYVMAQKFGLHYQGDVSPIPHGGYWYRLRDDDIENGYIEAVRIMDAEKVLYVDDLTVLLDWKRIFEALHNMGIENMEDLLDDDKSRPHLVIDALISYGHYDQNRSVAVRLPDDDEPFYVKLREERLPDNSVLTENQILNLVLQIFGIR